MHQSSSCSSVGPVRPVLLLNQAACQSLQTARIVIRLLRGAPASPLPPHTAARLWSVSVHPADFPVAELFAQLLSDPQALGASAGAEQTAVLLPSCLSRNLPCTASAVRCRCDQKPPKHDISAEQPSQGEHRLPTAQPEASAHQRTSQQQRAQVGSLQPPWAVGTAQ